MNTKIKKWSLAVALCIMGIMMSLNPGLQMLLVLLLIYYSFRIVYDIQKILSIREKFNLSPGLKKDLWLNFGSGSLFLICVWMYAVYRHDDIVLTFMGFSLFMYVISFIHCLKFNRKEMETIEKKIGAKVRCQLATISRAWEKV